MRFELMGYLISYEPGLFDLFILSLLAFIASFHLYRRKSLETKEISNFEILKEITELNPRIGFYILLLNLAVGLLLISAFSGSLEVHELDASHADTVLLVDNGFSMELPDYEPTRLEAAKEASVLLLDSMPEDSRVGAVSFSGDVEVLGSLDEGRSSAMESLKNLTADLTTFETDISSALLEASEMFSSPELERRIVIVTDADELNGSLSSSVRKVRRENITVGVVALASTEETRDVYRKVYSELNISFGEDKPPETDYKALSRISNSTGGRLFRVTDSTSLERSLTKYIDETEPKELHVERHLLSLLSILIILQLAYLKYRGESLDRLI